MAERRSQARRSGAEESSLNPLQFIWWMITENYTVMTYFLIISLLLGLMIVLGILGMVAH